MTVSEDESDEVAHFQFSAEVEERCFSGLQIHSLKTEPEIIIDSGSTISLMKYKCLLEKYRSFREILLWRRMLGPKELKERSIFG